MKSNGNGETVGETKTTAGKIYTWTGSSWAKAQAPATKPAASALCRTCGTVCYGDCRS